MASDLSNTARKNEAIANYDRRTQSIPDTPVAPARQQAAASPAPTVIPSTTTTASSNDSSWRYGDNQRAADAERARRRAQQDAQDELDDMARRVRRAERDAAYARQAARDAQMQSQPPVVVYRNTPSYGSTGVATGAAIGAGAVMANEQMEQQTQPVGSRVSSSTLDAMAGIEKPTPAAEPAESDSGTSFVTIFMIVGILALIAGGLYWFVFRKKKDAKIGRYSL